MKTYTVYGQKALFCDAGCRESFKCDRDHGLIYGPYGEKDKHGKVRFLSGPEEASLRWRQCCYCGETE